MRFLMRLLTLVMMVVLADFTASADTDKTIFVFADTHVMAPSLLDSPTNHQWKNDLANSKTMLELGPKMFNLLVEKTLADLGCADKPSMIVFNKIDNYTWTEKDADDLTPSTKENISLDELKRTWMARLDENCLFISALEKQNIDEFREAVYKRVRQLHVQKYPYNDFLYNVEEI